MQPIRRGPDASLVIDRETGDRDTPLVHQPIAPIKASPPGRPQRAIQASRHACPRSGSGWHLVRAKLETPRGHIEQAAVRRDEDGVGIEQVHRPDAADVRVRPGQRLRHIILDGAHPQSRPDVNLPRGRPREVGREAGLAGDACSGRLTRAPPGGAEAVRTHPVGAIGPDAEPSSARPEAQTFDRGQATVHESVHTPGGGDAHAPRWAELQIAKCGPAVRVGDGEDVELTTVVTNDVVILRGSPEHAVRVLP